MWVAMHSADSEAHSMGPEEAEAEQAKNSKTKENQVKASIIVLQVLVRKTMLQNDVAGLNNIVCRRHNL